jgi:hypothetical protein
MINGIQPTGLRQGGRKIARALGAKVGPCAACMQARLSPDFAHPLRNSSYTLTLIMLRNLSLQRISAWFLFGRA